jgi:hypothetical protein
MVCRSNRIFIVLDNEHGISNIAQMPESAK